MLFNKYGARAVFIGGAVLAAGGMVAGSFASQLWILYITFGFITGRSPVLPIGWELDLRYNGRLRRNLPLVAAGRVAKITQSWYLSFSHFNALSTDNLLLV